MYGAEEQFDKYLFLLASDLDLGHTAWISSPRNKAKRSDNRSSKAKTSLSTTPVTTATPN